MSEAILMLLILWLVLHLALRSRPTGEPYVISHRGAAAHAPENTLAGVSAAIDLGAKLVEIDVQRTADGELVVIHDGTVDRTTSGRGRVGDLTWDEIRELDAGGHFAPQFAGEPIPTLDAALALAHREGIGLAIEVKSPKQYPGVEEQVAAAIAKADAEENVVAISFDHEALGRIHEVGPDIPLGALYVWMGAPPAELPVRLVDVHWLSVILDPTLIRRCHARGHEVVVWTVNQPWAMRLLLWLGVDGITTDRPDVWRQVTAG